MDPTPGEIRADGTPVAAYLHFRQRAERAEAALKAIHANATSWHGDDEAKGRALNVIAAWALHPESIPPHLMQDGGS